MLGCYIFKLTWYWSNDPIPDILHFSELQYEAFGWALLYALRSFRCSRSKLQNEAVQLSITAMALKQFDVDQNKAPIMIFFDAAPNQLDAFCQQLSLLTTDH
ncbi:hypothetical protein Nepgr_016475 [Nepenthes gracilis]|uniref:Uncharacterized protein n=1 Tax=Nepenthes gracilis TaxID=150966 RepID=A0AAD3SPU3_NEPGR|nr:hypothetical protein Nepgr_016475 [Nepenthes gracilis]